MHVKFEVRSFNHFGAIKISISWAQTQTHRHIERKQYLGHSLDRHD